MERLALLCVAIGCGPSVALPADTDSGSSEDSRTGPMTNATSPSSSSESGVAETVPGDPTDQRFDLGPDTGDSPCWVQRDVGRLFTNVVILVDASQTIVTALVDHDNDPDTPDITRWSMLSTALAQHLPGLAPIATVGIQSFPNFDAAAPPDPNACVVEIDGPAPGAPADQLADYLPPPETDWFLGATPTNRALELALLQISGDPGIDRRILLLTDGAPNCNEGSDPPELFDDVDADASALADSLFGAGVLTHVVGIAVPPNVTGGGPEGDAITDHRTRLDELATAGGVPLTLADDAASLDTALSAFTTAAYGCRLRIPPELLGFDSIEVEIATTAVYQRDDETCAAGVEGYRYLETPAYDTIEFCGVACDAFRVLGSATVTGSCVIAE